MTITITNINDHAPFFLHDEKTFQVFENQADLFIGELSAQDFDAGDYGDFSYSIEDNGHLSISSNGSIIVKNAFDRETTENFSTRVSVTDSGGLSTQQDVHIEVIDVNDNSPVFSRQESIVFLDETFALRLGF